MNILFLTSSEGGLYTYTTELVGRLVELGHTIKVFSFKDHGKYGEAGVRDLFGTYDIIHSNFAAYTPITGLLRARKRTPYVFVSHGIPQVSLEPRLSGKIKFSIEDALTKRHAQHANITVSPSRYVQSALKTIYGIESKVIYHGVDPKSYQPRDKSKAKKLLGLENKRVLLWIGKLHPYKDPLTLIEAFRILSRTLDDIELVMIGSGELEETVGSTIRSKGLGEKIKLLKNVSNTQLHHFYDAADIFVHTAVNEAFGFVIAQAMANSLPVVAPRSGSCPELVNSDEPLFRVGDPSDLHERLQTILSNEETSHRLGQQNRARAVNEFSWEKATARYLQIYEDCLP